MERRTRAAAALTTLSPLGAPATQETVASGPADGLLAEALVQHQPALAEAVDVGSDLIS
eukprot:SAG11_NODE_24372_length_374_cov_0.930909_1_plen_59_part_00